MLFYQVGELFEIIAEGNSKRAIENLMDIRPDSAYIEKDGKIIKVDPKIVKINDEIIIMPGKKVPMDGIIVDGNSHVDESSLTGESKLIKKTIGDKVIGSTTNKEGSFEFKATSSIYNPL